MIVIIFEDYAEETKRIWRESKEKEMTEIIYILNGIEPEWYWWGWWNGKKKQKKIYERKSNNKNRKIMKNSVTYITIEPFLSVINLCVTI